MPRLLRTQLDDGRYHLTARGAGSTSIFRTDLDRTEFLHGLDVTMRRYDWRLHAYCLMDTHYHLVLHVKGRTIPEAMRWLNGVYSRRFNKRHDRHGHLFGSRYEIWCIRDQRHHDATIRYVLNNPVRAGMCERAADWPWSYAAEEAGGLAAAA